MRRILVALDGSSLSETILPVAEEWAKEDDAEVILLRAVLADDRLLHDPDAAEVQVVGEVEAYLEAVAERLERRGLTRVRRLVGHDEPATAIVETVRRDGVDLIAMATHGRSGLRRVLVGSVAEAVVRAVPVPVLLLRGQSAWKPWATGRILVPLDGSEPSEAVLAVVERLAGPRDLTLSLLEVIEPFPAAAQARLTQLEDLIAFRRAEAERYLTKVAEPLVDKGVRVTWAVQYGRPAELIAAAAAEERADLIAMATHGRRGLERLFFGSVAEAVLRNASVPVLLLRAASGTAS